MNDILYTKNLLEKYGKEDSDVFQYIEKELNRQHNQIELIDINAFDGTCYIQSLLLLRNPIEDHYSYSCIHRKYCFHIF